MTLENLTNGTQPKDFPGALMVAQTEIARLTEQRDALLNALQSLLTDYRYVKSWCKKNGSQWVGSSQGVDIDAIRAIAQCGGGK